MAAFESLECFECSVCLEPMRAKRPVVLSCLHTFCTPCIKQLYRGQRLSCPTCRCETVVPGGDVNKLPVNRDLIKIIEQLEEMNKIKKDLRTVENLCQMCLKKGNQQQSVGMCFQCARRLCQSCTDKHKVTPAFKDHQLFTKVPKLEKDENICRRHSEDIQYICMACLEAVCVDCVGEQQHSDHMDQITKFERGISDLRKRNGMLIVKYDKQVKEINSIQKDISSDVVVLNTSKKNLEDLCTTFQKKQREIENLLQHIYKNELILQNANKLICDKKDKALHDQNLLKIAEECSDLAFLSKIKEIGVGSHYFENEVEIRRQTQNYTVPKTVLHDHVAICDLKSAPAASLEEHQPRTGSKWAHKHESRTLDEAQLAQEELFKEKMKVNSIGKTRNGDKEKKAINQIVRRSQELSVLKQEEKQVLHPFYSAMKDGIAKIAEDNKDKKSQWDPLRDETLVKILTNKGISSERRARILMTEGQIKEWYRAVNAVKLIDDEEIYGQGVTLRHIANAVNVLEGSVEECKKMLRQTCDACLDSFGTDQIQQLTFCNCKMCTDCFKTNFNVLIRDKDVSDWHCTLCHKPDMINNPNDALIEQHFQFLDIKVQRFLARDTYAIFTQKLNDWNLSRNPSFVYCPFEGCVNGFLHHDRLRVTCTACNRDFCWKCKNQWTEKHEDKTCDEAKLAQGEELIKENMKDNSIVCPNPNCGSYFELARGGCMHFTCSKCKKQFCQCCLKDFYTDPKKGLTCRHPRNCLFHLRDWDIDQLEKMLEENDVMYENDENPDEKECRIMVTIEDEPGKLLEARCDEKVKRNQNGLCEKHYKEFLVRIINTNNLDPVEMMSEKAISILLMRENVAKPPKEQIR